MPGQASVAFSVQGHCDDEAGSAVSEEIPSWNDRQGFSPCVIQAFYLSFQTLAAWKRVLFSGLANLCSPPAFYIGDTIAVFHQCTIAGECFLVDLYFQVDLSSSLSGTHVGGGGAVLFSSLHHRIWSSKAPINRGFVLALEQVACYVLEGRNMPGSWWQDRDTLSDWAREGGLGLPDPFAKSWLTWTDSSL